jgi:hypothetical protein
MASSRRLLAVCLAGVLVSLLLVGLASATVVRHVIQVAPIVLVLLAVWQRHPVTPYCALPIFMIWALLMVLIWMYLLDIATFFSGSFSPVEIMLTVLIGGFSAAGIVTCLRSSISSTIAHRIAGFVTFTIVQIAAMWISFFPAFANR